MRTGFLSAVVFLVGLAGLSSCMRPRPGYYIYLSGPIQGTTFHVTYRSPDSTLYESAILDLLQRFDMSLSTYQPASLISRINSNTGHPSVDRYFMDVFEASREIWEETGGAFDITIAPVVNAWGFGFTEAAEVDSALIDSLLQYVGMDMVHIENGYLVKQKEEIMLDVNAIAQGYAVDVVSGFLHEKGIRDYLVEIGGEVRSEGVNPGGVHWRVGVDKPIEGLQIPGVQMEAIISLSGRSLATSGNYRRFYEKDGIKYSHTIDPATGYPVRHGMLSATVLAADCMTADGYATAFMVMGLEKCRQVLDRRSGLDALLIYNDENGQYRVWHTRGLRKLLQ